MLFVVVVVVVVAVDLVDIVVAGVVVDVVFVIAYAGSSVKSQCFHGNWHGIDLLSCHVVVNSYRHDCRTDSWHCPCCWDKHKGTE